MTGPVVVGARSSHAGALHLAMRQALAGRTYVRVVHCCAPSATSAGQEVLDDLRRLARLDDHLSPPVGFELAGPRVVDVLERAARSAGALVLGCSDSRWFTELGPADVVARLTRHADCPVVVVPQDCATDSVEGTVVLGPVGAASSPRVVHFAFVQARHRRAVLRVDDRGSSVDDVLEFLRIEAQHPEITVEVVPGTTEGAGSADLLVLERPVDVSVPFGRTGSAVAEAIERGCAVTIVPRERHSTAW